METQTNIPQESKVEQKQEQVMPMSQGKEAWELMQRQAIAYSKSTLVPKEYQGPNGVSNCIIAMEMASRIGANALQVMQNLHVVQGRPGWSSAFLIACINQSGKFSSLRYEERGTPGQDDYAVRAWAIEKESGERLNGTWITWEMVKAEGWFGKAGSKWKTMPEQMAKYRAAAFWQRAYAPEISMGLHTADEVEDVAASKAKGSGMSIALTKSQIQELRTKVINGEDPDELINSVEESLGAPLPMYQKKEILNATAQ